MNIDKQIADIVAQRDALAFIAKELVMALILPANRKFVHPELLKLGQSYADNLNVILEHWAGSAGVFDNRKDVPEMIRNPRGNATEIGGAA